VGVGVSVDKNGIVWVTEDFREPMGGSSYSAPSSSSSGGSSHPASTTSYTPSTSAAPVVQPQPTLSPRAVLLHKLHELRQHGRHHATRKDPVAQSFDYVANLTRLAS